jgi:hypothetical protein
VTRRCVSVSFAAITLAALARVSAGQETPEAPGLIIRLHEQWPGLPPGLPVTYALVKVYPPVTQVDTCAPGAYSFLAKPGEYDVYIEAGIWAPFRVGLLPATKRIRVVEGQPTRLSFAVPWPQTSGGPSLPAPRDPIALTINGEGLTVHDLKSVRRQTFGVSADGRLKVYSGYSLRDLAAKFPKLDFRGDPQTRFALARGFGGAILYPLAKLIDGAPDSDLMIADRVDGKRLPLQRWGKAKVPTWHAFLLEDGIVKESITGMYEGGISFVSRE